MKQHSKIVKVSIATLFVASVAGCAVPVTQEQSGTVIGGVVGGVSVEPLPDPESVFGPGGIGESS